VVTPAEPGTTVGAGVEGAFVDVGVGLRVAVGAGAARVALAGGWVACSEADLENREAEGAATPKARVAIGTSRAKRLIRNPFFAAREAARAGVHGRLRKARVHPRIQRQAAESIIA
jgi:hypothetical protein